MVSRSEIIDWSKVGLSRDDAHSSIIGIEEIARQIGECDTVSRSILFAFDTYLSQKGLSSLFDSYALIPNRNGDKRKRSELRDATAIPQWLGELTKVLIPDQIATFADDKFIELAAMTPFTRNELKDAITNRLRSLRQEWLDKGIIYETPILEILLRLSSVFRSDTAEEDRKKTIKIIAEQMERTIDIRVLSPLDSNKRDIAELPFKHFI